MYKLKSNEGASLKLRDFPHKAAVETAMRGFQLTIGMPCILYELDGEPVCQSFSLPLGASSPRLPKEYIAFVGEAVTLGKPLDCHELPHPLSSRSLCAQVRVAGKVKGFLVLLCPNSATDYARSLGFAATTEPSVDNPKKIKDDCAAFAEHLGEMIGFMALGTEDDLPGETLRILRESGPHDSMLARLHRETEFLRSIIDAIPDIFYIKDIDLKILMVNRAFTDLFGLTTSSIIGKTDADFMPPDLAASCYNSDMSVLSSGTSVLSEETMGDEAGRKRVFETIKAPIRNEEGKIVGIVGISRDITAQREMENRVREASRNESLLRVAGSIAHDLNNSLSPVLGYAELASRLCQGNHKLRGYLDNIVAAVRSATQLTARLQAFGQRLVISSQQVDLSRLLDKLLPELGRVAQGKVRISLRTKGRIPIILGDPEYLRSAFVAFAENARDFLPSGSRMEFSLEEVENPQGGGSMLRILVTDDGPGMTPEVAEHAFEPFYSTKGLGSGLGLSMVSGLFKQLGGSVSLRTSPGNGCEFELLLPTIKEDADPCAVPEPPEAGARTVLVVDDEPLVVRLVQDILTLHGFEVKTASSSLEALKIASEHTGRIDLLITDAALDTLTGVDLYHQLQERFAEIKCVLMSGFSKQSAFKGSLPEEEFVFLQKPFSMSNLLGTVAEVLGIDE
ncbi:MAG: hypothetical protein Kow00107_00620 [Planctomycetota bacterium]